MPCVDEYTQFKLTVDYGEHRLSTLAEYAVGSVESVTPNWTASADEWVFVVGVIDCLNPVRIWRVFLLCFLDD
jgi:hypothetical protein